METMKSGAVLWEFKAIDVSKSLAIGFDGTIYFGSYTEKKSTPWTAKPGPRNGSLILVIKGSLPLQLDQMAQYTSALVTKRFTP